MGVFADQKISRAIAQSFLSDAADDNDADAADATGGLHEAVQENPAAAGVANRRSAERRRSFRRPLGIVATISRIINGELVHPLQVLIINASEHGYGMCLPAALACGELYHLRIGNAADGTDARTVRIVSCRRRRDESELFDVGVQVVA